ncbi:MAG: methionine adenosyltransferase [Chloroflexi bacterium]|nr:methionine adenosyltransferase [Chloroflexota bacterium]
MRNITIETLNHTPVGQQQVELVERKGRGHPDSICDAIMEEVSRALSREYLKTFGRVLHHNIDKGFLVAGRTSPKLGGGKVEEPMKLIFGDRAVREFGGEKIDVTGIAFATARQWFKESLRFVDPEKHVTLIDEIKPGSPELIDIFGREVIGANDTSAAVGYAPLTPTEQIVKATERYLNSREFKKDFPESGEDIKVMGFRRGPDLTLTVAQAFVDQFIDSEQKYFSRKAEIHDALSEYLARESQDFERVKIDINTLDQAGRGEGGMYLTVLGTSAEGGDSGQVGRGNKVNGVIALNRPMSTEAAAGKNPVSHVGKVYNLLSHRIANEVYQKVPGVREVYIWLCSQIGQPIDQPLIASAQLILQPGVSLQKISPQVEEVMEQELAGIYSFTESLTRGEHSVW